MKITGLVLIILGTLMIVLNIVGYFFSEAEPPPGTEGVNMVAYYIGYNLFLIVGTILVVIGDRLRRKAKMKKTKKELLDNFLSDSPEKTGS